ncbi:MAG: hypothetical protein J6S10_04585 [Clostridia bacterium]|nr:hypothetical protein [Clostridia bacterium]MBO7249916.1 hypothetical protein [Clostridia bacterium]
MKKAPISERISQKRICTALVVLALAFFFLQTFIINPLYVYTSSDVLFAVTPIPEILDILGDIIDPIGYALCFAAVSYSIFKFSAARSAKPIAILCVAFFIKWMVNYAISSIADGAITLSDIKYPILYFIFDMLIFIAVCIATSTVSKRYHERRAEIQKSNSVLGKRTPSVHEEIFEGDKLISLKNPLHFSAFFAGALLSLVKIATRVIFDIKLGAPTSVGDALWMITYYASDLLILVLVYAASLMLFSYFEKRDVE